MAPTANTSSAAGAAGRAPTADQPASVRNVVLVGHSRGGEGVSRASLEIPLTAPYTVVGQVLIGPTNFGRQTTPYVPTVTVLPSCDGDVIVVMGAGSISKVPGQIGVSS